MLKPAQKVSTRSLGRRVGLVQQAKDELPTVTLSIYFAVAGVQGFVKFKGTDSTRRRISDDSI